MLSPLLNACAWTSHPRRRRQLSDYAAHLKCLAFGFPCGLALQSPSVTCFGMTPPHHATKHWPLASWIRDPQSPRQSSLGSHFPSYAVDRQSSDAFSMSSWAMSCLAWLSEPDGLSLNDSDSTANEGQLRLVELAEGEVMLRSYSGCGFRFSFQKHSCRTFRPPVPLRRLSASSDRRRMETSL